MLESSKYKNYTSAVLFLSIFIVVLGFSNCKKWKDTPGTLNNQLAQRKYCNNPAAVNYNWNFPGVEDSSTCLFATDFYRGTYLLSDSVYNSKSTFLKSSSFMVHLYPYNRTQMALVGWCGATDTLHFTVSNNLFAAIDTIGNKGQRLCRIQDTISGNMTHVLDTASKFLKINFTVVADTGATLHLGSALKQ